MKWKLLKAIFEPRETKNEKIHRISRELRRLSFEMAWHVENNDYRDPGYFFGLDAFLEAADRKNLEYLKALGKKPYKGNGLDL
jgi:predicted translin family RNA/ssDNA-binding protein